MSTECAYIINIRPVFFCVVFLYHFKIIESACYSPCTWYGMCYIFAITISIVFINWSLRQEAIGFCFVYIWIEFAYERMEIREQNLICLGDKLVEWQISSVHKNLTKVKYQHLVNRIKTKTKCVWICFDDFGAFGWFLCQYLQTDCIEFAFAF